MAKRFSPKVARTAPDCKACKLSTVCQHGNLRFYGEGEKRILFINGTPSLEEDTKGKLGFGKEFRFLEMALEDLGYDFERDFYYTTAIGCKTARNRKPTGVELKHCLPRINRLIERLDPVAIVLLGETPFEAVIKPRISGRLSGLTAHDAYGDNIPDQDMLRWLCPTWSPAELFATRTYEDGGISKPYYERDTAVYKTWKQHLKRAVEHTTAPEKLEWETQCRIIMDEDSAIDIIREALSWRYVALDYESTGIKPHREGHKIWYASISDGDTAYSFPFFDSPAFLKSWKALLTSKSVGKIGHNNQYEAIWTFVRGGGYWIKNWLWDTMIGMHCVHNNKPTSLKYCGYREYGIVGYDSAMDEFLHASKEEEEQYGCNAINRIHEAPVEDALLYNAMDSLLSAKLYLTQLAQLTPEQVDGCALLVDTATNLAKMSQSGVIVASERFGDVEAMLQGELETYEKQIRAFPEVALWDREEKFNFMSTPQLSHLIFDLMGVRPTKFTKTLNKDGSKKPSLDKEAFEKLDLPILKAVEKYREFSKMASTYIQGWKREAVDGIIHSSFKLNTVDTFRSASSDPNLQNSYKRDEVKKKIVRSLIKAEPHAKLVEYDYKSLEVIVNGCHSNDPNLVTYCTDPSTDMHRDGTMDTFCLTKEGVKKEYRNAVKGLFIFSEFYGNYYKPIAKDLWEFAAEIPELMAHLKASGFTTLEKYTTHIEKCENILWKERFRVHDKWRRQQWSTYLSTGYLESHTGFRLQAPMSRNNSYNGKVQGDGFHCLCYLINHLQPKLEELGLRSYMINEIHDSLIMMVYPEEEHLVDYWVWWYGTQQIRQEWKWLTIPLQIEKEASAVGGVWCDMKGCGYLDEKVCMQH